MSPTPARGYFKFSTPAMGSVAMGLQILAPAMADDRLYRVGAAVEAALLEQWGRPILDSVPTL